MNRFLVDVRAWPWVLFVLLGLVAGARPARCQEPEPAAASKSSPLLPCPDKDALAKEQARIVRSFPRPKDSAKSSEWAKDRLGQARREHSGFSNLTRFALIELARAEAVRAHDAATAVQAIEALEAFAVDGMALRYRTGLALLRGADKVSDLEVSLLLDAARSMMSERRELAGRALLIVEQEVDRAGGYKNLSESTRRALADFRREAFDNASAQPPRRRAVPSEKERAAARKRIDRRLKQRDLRLASKKSAVARELVSDGMEFGDRGDAERFELLERAIALAEEIPSVQIIRDATDALAMQFEVDWVGRVRGFAGRAAERPAEFGTESVVRLLLEIAERSVPTRLDVAAEAAENAHRLCNSGGRGGVFEGLAAHAGRMIRQVRFLEETVALRQRLKEDPEDKSAAHRLGRVLCLHAGEWEQGLPLLESGGKYRWWEAARNDRKNPDDWASIQRCIECWDKVLGEADLSEDEKAVLQGRVRQWWQQAQPLAVDEFAQELVKNELKRLSPREVRLVSGSANGRDQRTVKRAESTPLGKGLAWLVTHQDGVGKWDADKFMKHDKGESVCDGAGSSVHDVGVTALAVMALQSGGSTPARGPHQEQITRGLRWLVEQQDTATGLVGTNTHHDFIYDHATASLALVRAYSSARGTEWRRPAQRAINYLESHRNPYSVWRYQPRDNDNDTSVTVWCATAYIEAQRAGLVVNQAALGLIENWLDQVTEPNGRHGYTKMGEKSSRKPGEHATRFPIDEGEAITAAGLSCRVLLGQHRDRAKRAVVRAAAARLAAKPPKTATRAVDHYYWYYGTIALSQLRGSAWGVWQPRFAKAVAAGQAVKGPERGSWSPDGAWGEDGGRVYSTALMCMALAAMDSASDRK